MPSSGVAGRTAINNCDLHPFTKASFAATRPSRTVKISTPRRYHTNIGYCSAARRISSVSWHHTGGEHFFMARKIAYWVSTSLVATLSLFAGFAYLSGSPQAVQGFAHVGYPQQLRIHSWNRETTRRAYAARSRLTHTQGVGVRGIHIRMALRFRCALSGEGWP